MERVEGRVSEQEKKIITRINPNKSCLLSKVVHSPVQTTGSRRSMWSVEPLESSGLLKSYMWYQGEGSVTLFMHSVYCLV